MNTPFEEPLLKKLINRSVDRDSGNVGVWISKFERENLQRAKVLCQCNNIKLNPDFWDFMIRNIVKLCEPLFDQASVLNIENRIGYAELKFDMIEKVLQSDRVRGILDDVTLSQSEANIRIKRIVSDDLFEVVKPA